MSRRRSRAVAPLLARAHEDAAARLADMTLRDDLLTVADLWPDVAARRAGGGGRALTGMPSAGDPSRIPVNLGAADVCAEIDRTFAYLVLALGDRGVDLTARTPPGRLRQAAYEAWRLDEHERIDLRDTAAELRHRCETVLGGTVRADWLGPCPTPGCVAEVHIAPGRQARTCRECGAEHTRDEQAAYIRECLEGRLMTLSELTSALKVCGLETPFRTVQTWARRRKLPERLRWDLWAGVPYLPPGDGLYPFSTALGLAIVRWQRGARANVEGSAA
ncbi:hypothetical protein GCM10027059_26680 [Myceligenerans halotolerans]